MSLPVKFFFGSTGKKKTEKYCFGETISRQLSKS